LFICTFVNNKRMNQPNPTKTIAFLIAAVLLHMGLLSAGNARKIGCSAALAGDTLIIQNSRIVQKWIWNQGDLSAFSLQVKTTGKTVRFSPGLADFSPGKNSFVKNIAFRVTPVAENLFYPAHLEVVLENQYQTMQVKRVFRIFPNTPAVSCDNYLKYKSLLAQPGDAPQQVDGTEKTTKPAGQRTTMHLGAYGLASGHWQVRSVLFRDVTDRNDNLVSEQSLIPFRSPEPLQGNLLFADDLAGGNGFFILKEAPNGASQVAYPGHDFTASNKEIKIPFSGFPADASNQEWIKGYTITTGTDGLTGLRQYLKNSIPYNPGRYEMVMMNTWGDRGQDGKISEKFILAELEKAADLGITHFQIDDGWQQGLSSNSASKAGRLWNAWTPENWELNRGRFPNGWDKILASAREKNIQPGLWFHPSNENNYACWETDAEVIIGLYKKTGIRYYKIDGVEIPGKVAEQNLTRFFEKVKAETNGGVFLNLDLTAGTRGGYFMFRSMGNLFLENRYTDWGNYYPFHTLRNLWMLSRYFPPELLQVEFLNKWRNAGKYPAGDPFAPAAHNTFDYLFAITMAGQPLAWFEATGLPERAFRDPDLIRKYRAIQTEFHSGMVFPIGDEPSGRSWTGFQSVGENKGFLLVLRENTPSDEGTVRTCLPPGKKVRLYPVLGQTGSEGRETAVQSGGLITVKLTEIHSFVLYRYELVP